MTENPNRASRASDIDILVSEVGPRDGLQSVDRTMPTAVKHRWIAALADAGLREIEVTTGYADPAQVRRLFTRLRAELGERAGGAHLHNTRGRGLANVVAALDVGVTTFDSSQAGLGGCPYAPGASGNIVTEDLIYLLESMGLRTGVDLEALLAARAIITEGLPGEDLYGHLPDAGPPKGFHYASQSRIVSSKAAR